MPSDLNDLGQSLPGMTDQLGGSASSHLLVVVSVFSISTTLPIFPPILFAALSTHKTIFIRIRSVYGRLHVDIGWIVSTIGKQKHRYNTYYGNGQKNMSDVREVA
ncbi:hypothetical protein DFH29DRAFT_998480 [Suillus ampliporus]|nr:hypothetical protein DFH29DRAFT_998480 [Suillus ampliporus]